MIEEFDLRSEEQDKTDKTYEIALRPNHLEDFLRQDQVVENLRIFVSAARMRAESLDHVLLRLYQEECFEEQNLFLYRVYYNHKATCKQ